MYTMLGDEVDEQKAVAEIQMLRDAAVRYKSAPGNGNNYATLESAYGWPYNAALKPYLGKSGLGDGINVFGGPVDLYIVPYPDGNDLVVEYYDVPNSSICVNILNRFGKVTDNGDGTYQISPGDTITGYVGGNHYDTGCEIVNDGTWLLVIHID